jgi:hypothetical protein
VIAEKPGEMGRRAEAKTLADGREIFHPFNDGRPAG